MKAAVDYVLILFAVLVLSACAGTKRQSSYSSIIERDPATGAVVSETRTETHDAGIKASGYKVDLEGLHFEERRGEGTSQGPGDYHYTGGAESAGATPQSSLLEGAQLGAQLATRFARLEPLPSEPAVKSEDIEELKASIEALKAALEQEPE